MVKSKTKISVGSFPVLKITASDLAQRLLTRLHQSKQTALFFANTNFIMQCIDLRDRMLDADVMVVNDGVGMDIAARLIHGERFQENLNGTDFIPYLFLQAPRPLRVFMLGGKPDVLHKAAEYATKKLGQEIVGVCDGYGGLQSYSRLVDVINETQAEVILVAMGNPLQEKWILDHRDQLNAKILSGVGALFDFWAGNKPRAPVIARKLRMEWFYRLCLEPRRLIRRYTVDILRFMMRCYRLRHH